MKKWMAIMLLIAIALFGSVIGFNLFKQKMIAKYMANRPEPEFPVTAMVTKAQDWIPTIEAIGFIEPNQGVTLSTELAGTIDAITFESGKPVKADQLLLSLDSSVEKANLRASQAKLPAAKAKFDRFQNLYKTSSISKEQLDEAEAAYRSLEADIESLKATIARREVRAPFSGVVGLRNVFLGQYLQPGTDIVRLEDTSVMRLRFTVPQTDISKIKLGQIIKINVDAYPQTQFDGHITAIEPAVNYQSGLIQVQADIPNNDGQLRSGMFARASIILPTVQNQIVVPQSAISFTLYGQNVYVLKESEETDKEGKKVMVKRAKQVVVKAGERRGNDVHVLSGIQAGDEIVLSGQVRLSNDTKVHVVENDALAVPAQTPML
ncbi:efflux RND transporter periplasmic adaptor subunit [Aeromonas jandaei]|uniref:Efflux RND transporter periplasmic adaptor subunit n=1 Tax=Aeromonas jandaei TaxID=650 RepID=A0ABX6ZHA6_AERJA|nr:efflux RND transporter periplasmic adaptor subunit [Aeromonas jandaei]MBL0547161.1 efflux RND transporter periplasmic adaptor subunit [Aeromonas jandaei]MBW3808037.1 efflux RND transporter periplasmic adaptor subunit [Aeromonas jandaei]PPA28066.1 MexH family multidrug efflux RND transporter periplasmic adaptor subunit [Aeromonas jandaei]QQB18114.1 efflux RND transporter periplasmic adaptor subunit [Aeromonas jandaei]UCA32781.1 efflux RND transporter periplasmic adaptor subunit [Aeromonas ja